MICVESVAGFSPSFSQTDRSIRRIEMRVSADCAA